MNYKILGMKLSAGLATAGSFLLPFMAKADLSADMTEVASVVGNSFQAAAVDVLTTSLPYLIPVVLLFAAFYFIWRKMRGAIR